jgi:hypothetical protein
VTEGDDLFEYLEREIKNVLAKVILGNIRATYLKFMTEIGPSHGKLKLDALYDSQPDFDPATANDGAGAGSGRWDHACGCHPVGTDRITVNYAAVHAASA